ncbi:hypothetical protein BDZ89DRAFT_1151286 [Hymenopellis radicata]|nr:hypothetical protein BDZ89DRAFT_1151286 [Hymenopellis radicata]
MSGDPFIVDSANIQCSGDMQSTATSSSPAVWLKPCLAKSAFTPPALHHHKSRHGPTTRLHAAPMPTQAPSAQLRSLRTTPSRLSAILIRTDPGHVCRRTNRRVSRASPDPSSNWTDIKTTPLNSLESRVRNFNAYVTANSDILATTFDCTNPHHPTTSWLARSHTSASTTNLRSMNFVHLLAGIHPIRLAQDFQYSAYKGVVPLNTGLSIGGHFVDPVQPSYIECGKCCRVSRSSDGPGTGVTTSVAAGDKDNGAAFACLACSVREHFILLDSARIMSRDMASFTSLIELAAVSFRIGADAGIRMFSLLVTAVSPVLAL